MWDEHDLQRHLRELEAIGIADAVDEALDLQTLASELGVSRTTLRMDVDQRRRGRT
jgi:hypothetical protein